MISTEYTASPATASPGVCLSCIALLLPSSATAFAPTDDDGDEPGGDNRRLLPLRSCCLLVSDAAAAETAVDCDSGWAKKLLPSVG